MSWLTQLLARRPFKVVAIALANKMARVAWALLAKGGSLSGAPARGSLRRGSGDEMDEVAFRAFT